MWLESGKRGQVSCVGRLRGFFVGEDEALGGEADGGGHVLREGEFAVVLLARR